MWNVFAKSSCLRFQKMLSNISVHLGRVSSHLMNVSAVFPRIASDSSAAKGSTENSVLEKQACKIGICETKMSKKMLKGILKLKKTDMF